MKKFLFLCALPCMLMAQDYQRVPPEQIEAELEEAEARFEHAKKLFNPWYTGPIITPSASMVDPGMVVYQPYLFFTDTYGAFNNDREMVDAPNFFQVQAIPIQVQTGITSSVDTTVTLSTVGNWSQGHSGGGLQDISANVGFSIAREKLYTPKAKLTIAQSFPTGKYQNLSSTSAAVDATGSGAWGTSFTLALGKLFFWDTLHPFNTRVALTYKLSTPVHVRGFNTYGGGFGTHGTVKPGDSFSADMGLELSINQPWVVALDIVYQYQNKTKFHGTPGITAAGTPASVGGGYSDQLSLAPAVEYNFNAKMGLLGGVWFSVYGRNSSNFISGVFSWYGLFP